MNDNEKKFEQYLEDIDFDDAPDSAHRDLLEKKLLLNFTASSTRQNIKWRTIMQNKVTKFAVAAVIILGILVGLQMMGISPDGSSVAWASLAERVKQIKTVTYKMHMKMKNIPTGPDGKTMNMTMDQHFTMSSDYGMRMDMTDGDEIVPSAYLLFAENEMITLIPPFKKYMRVTLTDDLRKKYKDPRQMVVGFMDVDYIELGRKEIDGVEVEGVEINDPKAMGDVFPEFVGRLWVDIETDLPVLMDLEFKSNDGMEVKMSMTDFQWNIELDESEFVCIIPEDYESMGEVKMPEMNADGAIEGLKMLVVMYDGKFPKNLNMMDVMKFVNEFRMKESKEESKARIKQLEESTETGIAPNTILKDQKEDTQVMMQKMIGEQMKIQGVCMFYMQLVQEKKDPAYYGDRITPEDTDLILMRWQNKKDGYTVIFGDLSTGDFTAEEVGEMEALLPEPPEQLAPPEKVIEVEVLKPLPVVPTE